MATTDSGAWVSSGTSSSIDHERRDENSTVEPSLQPMAPRDQLRVLISFGLPLFTDRQVPWSVACQRHHEGVRVPSRRIRAYHAGTTLMLTRVTDMLLAGAQSSPGRSVVTQSRPPHPQTDVEFALSAAESADLVVTYNPVGFGTPGAQPGWYRVHCPRGCHEAIRIDAQKVDRITKRVFFRWFTGVMMDHDKADVEGS